MYTGRDLFSLSIKNSFIPADMWQREPYMYLHRLRQVFGYLSCNYSHFIPPAQNHPSIPRLKILIPSTLLTKSALPPLDDPIPSLRTLPISQHPRSQISWFSLSKYLPWIWFSQQSRVVTLYSVYTTNFAHNNTLTLMVSYGRDSTLLKI